MANAPISLRLHAVRSTLIICAATFAAGCVIGSARLIDALESETAAELKNYAQMAVQLLADTSAKEAEKFCSDISSGTQARVVWLTPDGKILADSEFSSGGQLSLRQNPELRSAAFGTAGTVFKKDVKAGVRRVIVAVPALDGDGNVVAIVRLSRALHTRGAILNAYGLGYIVTGLLAAVLLTLTVSTAAGKIDTSASRLVDAIDRERVDQIPSSRFEEVDRINTAVRDLAERFSTSSAAAARQKAETDTLFASMREGILVVDDRDSLLLINQAAAGFLAVQDVQAATNRPYLESIRNADLRDCIRRTRLQSAEIAPQNLILDDGINPQRILRVSSTRVDYGEGRPFAVLMVMSDITRMHRLERMRAQFAANVSHELKTPLTAIKGYTELLDDVIETDSVVKPYAATIDRHVDRMIAIINDLLYLSRIEHGDSELVDDFRTFPIGELLQQCAAIHREAAEAKSLAITVEAPARSIRGNRRLLDRAISNLLCNAIRYSDEGGEVRLSVSGEDDSIVLTVADDGHGIDQTHHQRIFERFYRVDEGRDRDSGGTGLGLAIVKHIALLHGGTVDLESSPGHGSRFKIVLPR
jgi:two-component system phosphate regulon sensor histidine kinase PhoR